MGVNPLQEYFSGNLLVLYFEGLGAFLFGRNGDRYGVSDQLMKRT